MNAAGDRAVAARGAQVAPVTTEIAVTNRAFLGRAVRTLVEAGSGSSSISARACRRWATCTRSPSPPTRWGGWSTSTRTGSAVLARYREAMAPGSHLVLTHLSSDIRTAEVEHTVELMRHGPSPVFARDPAAIAALFGDFRLLEPGLVHATRWRPGPGVDVAAPPILAGVAVRPGS